MSSHGDFYINDYQVNTARVNVNIPQVDVNRTFNNAKYTVPGRNGQIIFPVSANSPTFTLTISMFGRGDIWADLTQAEKDIFDELDKQITQRTPIRIRHSLTNFYYTNKDIFVFIDSDEYFKKGSNGTNLLELTFECSFYGVSTADGGTIDPNDPWNPIDLIIAENDGIGSLTIGTFTIGSS